MWRGGAIRSLCAVGIGTLLLGATSVLGVGAGRFEAGAEAWAPATRGSRVSTSRPEYPAGECDAVTGGLTLGTNVRPNDQRMIGESAEGRTIWAEHWGRTDAPQIVMVGQVHGNECAPIVFSRMVRAFDWQHAGVWLIPTLNPDGYARLRRQNAVGHDLNQDGYHVSQLESVALLEFTAFVQPELNVHVHSPNGFVGWFGTPTAARVAAGVSEVTGLRYTTAGTRHGRNWFLWQGQQQVAPAGAVLLEINPVVRWEAPSAFMRAPVLPLAELEAMATRAAAAIDAVFAP